MGQGDVVAPEDVWLCRHEWMDMYGGSGVSKDDPYLALQAFFCKFCLQVRVKSWRQDRYWISADNLKDYRDDEGTPA